MNTKSGSRAAVCRLTIAICALTMLTPVLWGWGPHGHIIEAALAALAKDHRLPYWWTDAGRLRLYVLLGDWRDCFISMDERWAMPRQNSLPGFQMYSNDYLIFPQAPRHYNHTATDLPLTLRPFFMRALQALRTETPTNAARWIGSLMHFVTDSGAPPHAGGVTGETHTKMENWLDPSKIELGGYKPLLFGETDKEALAGFLRRMDGLMKFSIERARRLRPLVEAGDRKQCEPIVLECALESARVAADTLHTLLVLSAKGKGGGELYGDITAPTATAVRLLPAKLILKGTSYSTTSEMVQSRNGVYQGVFMMRNIPPGTYQATVYRVGAKPVVDRTVVIKPGVRTGLSWTLEAQTPAGNLIRNPDFQIRWTSEDAPEHWRYNSSKRYWVSDNIKIEPGGRYRAGVDFRAPGRVSVQWMRHHVIPLGEGDTDLSPAGGSIQAPQGAVYAQILVHGKLLPPEAVRFLWLVEEDRPAK